MRSLIRMTQEPDDRRATRQFGKRTIESILIVVMIGWPLSVVGQPSPNTQRYLCRFSKDDGERLHLEFTRDFTTNRAFIVGNNGLAPVLPVDGTDLVTFLEVLRTGAVQTTSISWDGSALHSRSTFSGGKFIPSQWAGVCALEAR
jgi:hypothetical protein